MSFSRSEIILLRRFRRLLLKSAEMIRHRSNSVISCGAGRRTSFDNELYGGDGIEAEIDDLTAPLAQMATICELINCLD
ncbi:unnamed protein product [Protopolystoma xenopodis]|uniref:Uncharacterized protein n=1 Tax=Protopolystoma xenopodis TaxID=117903 RepID=A0A3S5BB16_9PLAT|nr:unnamed protein product [Protopolystoma xenopodis]